MSKIKVTYNVGQDFTDNSGMKQILRDLKTWGATEVKAHPDNFRFESIFIDSQALKVYCEIIGLDYWVLIKNVILLCMSSETSEIARYGDYLSNIENIDITIIADQSIKNVQVPDEIHKSTIVNSEGVSIPNNNTFAKQFTIDNLSDGKVTFPVIVGTSYPTKEQLFALDTFSNNNLNFNIQFTHAITNRTST